MVFALSTQTLVVGALAILLPILLRIVSSPFTLLLLSPLILLVLVVSGFVAAIFTAHILDAKRRTPPKSLLRSAKPFVFSTPAAWQAVTTRLQWSQKSPQALPPLIPSDPVISAAVNDLLILIVRDFVLVWYKDISSSPSFPVAVSSVLHQSMEKLLTRASEIDLASLLIKRILPKITSHIEQFQQSEVALRGAGLERRLTQSEELDILLASRYASKGDGKLHPAVENLSTTFTKQAEEEHLRRLVERALPFILPEPEASSKVVKIVVREIVSCAVLYPIMEMVGDPDFWNKAIDQVAGEVIHQQKLISRVRNVLEAQSPLAQNRLSTASTLGTSETINIHTDARQFESFLRSINRCSSLLDARRLKNDIVGEVRRTRLLLAKHEKEDWIDGEKTEDVVAFLDRLYTAKRKVEQRIVVLGGEDDTSRQTAYQENPKSGLTLRDILQNPSALSYFMEFMDRKNRSLLVQFWLTVESFKTPLESVDSDSEADADDPIKNANADTIVEDVSMVKDLYFSSPDPHPALATIPKKHMLNIRSFTGPDVTSDLTKQRKARRSVLLAQRHVEREMQQDFEDFERSELWFRVMSDTDIGGKKAEHSFAPKERPLSTHSRRSSKLTPPSLLKPILPPAPQLISRSESDLMGHRSTSAMSSKSSDSSGSIPHPPKAAPSNIEVLMSPIASESDASRAPLFGDPDDETERMDAIQAALTDIIHEERTDKRPPAPRRSVMSDSSFNNNQSASSSASAAGKRRAVFDDFYDDNDADEEEPNEEGPDHNDQNIAQAAVPGDLHLSYEISRLRNRIAHLTSQEAMLDTLIRKAELTGDTQELRLLSKSKAAMDRELRELKFQKTQYEQQESANRLVSERTKVAIVSSTAGEEEGKSVVRYLVEVQQLGPDGTHTSGWVVARRYNEFLATHNKLRERYALVRNLEFPGKRLVAALTGSFVDTRKSALEKYLQSLVAIPAVCESDELRTFLSKESPFMASKIDPAVKGSPSFGTDLVRTAFRSVAESIDDMIFGPSMLDVMIQRLTRQAAEFAGIVGSGVTDEDLVARALDAGGKASPEATLMRLSSDLKPLEGETSTSTFSAPICDLILAVFELNKKNNWLRRQAIVIILQQVLGGTIERKIRDTVKSALTTAQVMPLINAFRDGLWPGGKLKPPGIPRTAEEKMHTRDEANRKLSSLVPELAANMIGRSNARRGARRIFAVLQNKRLNQHVAYMLVDEIFNALFPEAAARSGGGAS